jgi:metallophosphoesterase (TIGR00282 family)
MNLMGRVFMEPLDCPFRAADREIEALHGKTNVIVVDMHAEATSEKIAMGWHLDGRVSAVLGTHTHVQTADERILEKGTAYISDVGMTGPRDSIIGMKREAVLERFVSGMPARFEVASGPVILNAVVTSIDVKTGRAQSIVRVTESVEAET